MRRIVIFPMDNPPVPAGPPVASQPNAEKGEQAKSLPTLVLIHGLYSSPKEFALLERVLRNRNVAFDFLEVPGYTAASRSGRLKWQEWVELAARALDARHPPGSPIVLGGLCVGGAIAAALVRERRPQRIVGLAMLSSTFEYDGWSIGRWQRCRRIAYSLGFDRWISVREREPFGIRNPKTRQWVKQELESSGTSAVGPAAVPLRAIREAERLYASVRRSFPSIEAPILALHAREDEMASVTSIERVLATANAPARLIVLEHSFHMITIDNDRQRVAHELCDFVGAPSVSQPPPPKRPGTQRVAAANRAA